MSDHTPPAASVTITLEGESREIFMPFNQLNRLTYLVGQVENMSAVMLNPEMRMQVLLDMLTVREKGKVVKAYTDEDLDISQDDAIAVLDFAQEHLMDFFVRAATKVRDLTLKSQPRLVPLNSTPTPTGQGS